MALRQLLLVVLVEGENGTVPCSIASRTGPRSSCGSVKITVQGLICVSTVSGLRSLVWMMLPIST